MYCANLQSDNQYGSLGLVLILFFGEERLMVSIEEAAKLLGRKRCGKVPHVVGTSVRRPPKIPGLFLCIDVDSDAPEVEVNIDAEIGSSTFEGYGFFLHLTGTPKFGKL